MADASGLRRAVESRANIIARRLTIDIDRELHQAAKQHHKTGKMEQAIKVTPSRTSPTTWQVDAEVPIEQAYYTDQGNNKKGEYITPKRAKALKIVLDGNVVIFRMRVKAYKGSRWFSNIMNEQHVHSLLMKFVGR